MWSAPVRVEWLPDGRTMELLQRLTYTDSNGRKWSAPKGMMIDGASIPWFLWRAIGSPYTGKYRRASVIHDAHCTLKERPSPEVHAMFYEAMLDDGTAPWKARVMWLAVRVFGPRFKSRVPF